MQSKIMQVFYGNDCLPYKDKERQVHYPITGSAFLGASNTTEIRFYIERIGNEDDTWVANSKLPNGKMGNKILQTYFDSEVGEYYAKLQLSSFYTQAKGDVYISLNGFSGSIDIDYDDGNDIYTINGVPTIQATGCVKLAINYATPLIDGEDIEAITLAQVLDEVGNKVSKNSGHYLKIVNDIDDINDGTYDDYLTGNDIVYDKTTKTFYKLSGVVGELESEEIELSLGSLNCANLYVSTLLQINDFSKIKNSSSTTLTDYITEQIGIGVNAYFNKTSDPQVLTTDQYNSLINNPNMPILWNGLFYLKGTTSGTSDTYYSIKIAFNNSDGYITKPIETIILTKSSKTLSSSTAYFVFYNKLQTDALLSTKQNTLTFDNTPTSGSNNPVISSGIKSALDTKQNTLVAGNGITISGNVISASGSIEFQIVEELPASGASNVIYLLPLEDSEEDNIYEEYIWVNNDWELIGTTNIDLSDYYTKSETDTQITNAKELFYCTYGTTTFAQITQALSDGKLPICLYNDGRYYIYCSSTSTVHRFSSMQSDYVRYTTVNDSDVWAISAYNLELVGNKVASISSSSTNTQYPSAKCVYDNLVLKQDALVSGTNIKTINSNSILGSGNITIDSASITEITYADLVSARTNSTLKVGTWYRITDYRTYATGTSITCANHDFDLLVFATKVNELSEQARATLHSGDTYFANNNLNAWQVWYCLDNDSNRFAWADTTNGKGVIYRLIDEFNNDVPYDFKNILYSTYFVFTYTDSGFKDASLLANKSCYNNLIKPYFSSNKQALNKNVFVSFDTTFSCYNNTFEIGCQNNNFGKNCYNNTFGRNYQNNIMGNYCQNNITKNGCYNNTFGSSCSNNTLGTGCSYNYMGDSCTNNTFGNSCQYIIFGTSTSFSALITYVQNVIVDNGCKYINLYSTDTTASSSNQLQNIHIHLGVIGSSSSNRLNIEVPDRALEYSTDYFITNSTEIYL